MCIMIAAAIAGPEAYPPTPTTTSGPNTLMILRESTTARGRSNMVRMRVIRFTFFGPHFYAHQPKTGLRDQPGFHAARGPHEQHFSAVAGLQFAGDRQRRNHMSAGASTGYQYAHTCGSPLALNVADQNSATKCSSGGGRAKALRMTVQLFEESDRDETNPCFPIQSKLLRAG